MAQLVASDEQRRELPLKGDVARLSELGQGLIATHMLTGRKQRADISERKSEALGAQVGSLAQILGNKQARGAFGEVQLRQLIEDRLPADGFAWQHTLSNGTRCDCLIRLPHPPGPIAVDSKFPLEAWLAASTGRRVVFMLRIYPVASSRVLH